MDRRRIAVSSGALGLLLAGAAFLLVGGRSQAEAVAPLEARIAAAPVRAKAAPALAAGPRLAALSLFPAVSGPATAAPETVLRLEGVARSPVRTAALVSIDGAPAEWLSVGDRLGAVTLRAVSGSGATFETPRGERHVPLGEASAPAAAAADELSGSVGAAPAGGAGSGS